MGRFERWDGDNVLARGYRFDVAQNLTQSVSLHGQIEDMHERQVRLEEAFLYERAVDRETYERQRDKLNEQIMLAEMEERESKLEGYDVESVLALHGARHPQRGTALDRVFERAEAAVAEGAFPRRRDV